MRAVVDSNVWVSAMVSESGHPARIKRAWAGHRFDLVVCCQLLREVIGVLRRPHIQNKYAISDEEIDELHTELRENSTIVHAEESVYHLRDPQDDFLLSAAIAGRADVIVTRDGDLRGDPTLPGFLCRHSISVVSVQGFLDILEVGPQRPL